MRAVLVLALFGVAIANPRFSTQMDGSKRILEDEILSVSECLRDALNAGDPDHDLPSFNPLHIDDIFIDFSDLLHLPSVLDGDLDLHELHLEGITTWDFTELEGTVSLIPVGYKVHFKVHFDEISGHGKHHADHLVLFEDIELFGEGEASGAAKNLDVWGDITIELGGDGIKVSKVDVKADLDSLEFTITGLKNDEEYSQQVSDYLTNEFADWVHNNTDDFGEFIDAIVERVIDAIRQNGGLGDIDADSILGKCLAGVLP